MDCPTCGAKLQIEDEKCPFCGNPNPFAQKHRQDMHYYQQEFQKTKSEVEKKTNFFTTYTVKISAIAVLILMIIGMVYLRDEGVYDIWKYQTQKDIQTNEKEYKEQLNSYEEEENWNALQVFYDEKSLYLEDSFDEFHIVYYAACDYQIILRSIMSYEEDSYYYGADYVAAEIAKRYEELEQYGNRVSFESEYYDACYAKNHREALERIQADVDALLVAYCNLTQEEVEALADFSLAKKSSLLEEGLLRGKR